MIGNFNGDRDDVADVGYVGAAVTIGTTQVEVKVGASRVAGRQFVMIYNDSLVTMYFGPSGVTTSGSTKGIPLLPRQFVSLPVGNQAMYLIAGTASNSAIIQEIS